MKKLLLVCFLGALVLSVSAHAATISTLLSHNNSGSLGGAVYFDLAVGPGDITVTGFTTHVSVVPSFGFNVYLTAPGGTSSGSQTNAGLWSSVATGSGTGQGENNPSAVVMNDSFVLLANTTYGVALVLGPEVGHLYTNGDGSNQIYSNSDLSLTLGSASNSPFIGGVFDPRVWNGSITYDVSASAVPEPATIAMFAAGFGLISIFRRRR